MKHSIRQRVINEYGLPVTKIETVTGELGSGIRDMHGNEIFEGDCVKINGELKGKIIFDDGRFNIDLENDKYVTLSFTLAPRLEIVGCVED